MAKSATTKKATSTTKKSTKGTASKYSWKDNRSAPVDKTKRIAKATVSEENIITGTRKRKAVDYREHKVIKTSKKPKVPKSKNTLEARQKAAAEAPEKKEKKKSE